MTFFRVGPAGIPGSIKTDMNNVLNKKFGTTGQDYPPADWPADVNLLGELEVKTASGSIASFTDGADDVPISNGVFDVDYTGTAITGMTIRQAGKNLLNEADKSTNGNLVVFDSALSGCAFPYLPAGTYTFTTKIGSGFSIIEVAVIADQYDFLVDEWGEFNDFYSYTFTISVPKKNVRIELLFDDYVSSVDVVTESRFCYGSSAISYEPFISVADKSVDFDGSIYGGTYNSVTGILTSTKAEDGTDLAQPVETDIGATEINSLLGNNSIFCDTGSTAVQYRSSGTITPVPVQPTLITKTITENDTYNAADDNADGYSQVNVNVSGGASGLVVMDFTSITVPFTANGVSYGATGAVFDGVYDYISIPLFHAGTEMEIDVGTMNLTAAYHRRFVTSNDNQGFMFRRDGGGVWSFYNGSWYDTAITDGSYFSNSTVKIVVDSSNYWHIYKDDVLIFEPAGALALTNPSIGSSAGNSINSAIITGIRIKETI